MEPYVILCYDGTPLHDSMAYGGASASRLVLQTCVVHCPAHLITVVSENNVGADI
jgi:hypothetical protein